MPRGRARQASEPRNAEKSHAKTRPQRFAQTGARSVAGRSLREVSSLLTARWNSDSPCSGGPGLRYHG